MMVSIQYTGRFIREKLQERSPEWLVLALELIDWVKDRGGSHVIDHKIMMPDGERVGMWTINLPDDDTLLLFKLTWL